MLCFKYETIRLRKVAEFNFFCSALITSRYFRNPELLVLALHWLIPIPN